MTLLATLARRRIRSLTALLLLPAGVVGGCSQMRGMAGQFGLGGGPLSLDPADTCQTERRDFGESKTYFTDEIVESTLIGAGVGAATGAFTSVVTGQNITKSTLTGAGIGGIGGFAKGYYDVRQQQARDKDVLARQINADLRTEGDQIDHVLATFSRLRDCRYAEAKRIKREVRAGTADRTFAATQLDYHRRLFEQEIDLAHQYGAAMEKRDSEFQSASSELQRDAARQAPRATHQVRVAATQTIPEKRSTFEKNVDKAEGRSVVAFNVNDDTTTGLFPAAANRDG